MKERSLDIKIYNNQFLHDRPALLLLHGMWHGAWVWEEKFIPYLMRLDRSIVVFSLSGHGSSSSSKPFNLLRIKDYVNDLAEVADALPLAPIIVGHSMGGYILQKYLETHTPSGAVLMASVPPTGIWGGTFRVLRKFPFIFLKSVLTLHLKTIINSVSRYNYLMCSGRCPEEEVMQCLQKIDSESFLAYQDMLGLNRIHLKEIVCPFLLLGGEKDVAVSVTDLEQTERRYKAQVHLFKEMGHNLMLEPGYKSVADRITSWIAEQQL